MKRLVKIVSSIDDYASYLKERGKIDTDEALVNARVSKKGQNLILMFEGPEKDLPVLHSKSINDFLNKNAFEFFRRKNANGRVLSFIRDTATRLLGIKYGSRNPHEDQEKLLKKITIRDVLSISSETYFKQRNVGAKTLRTVIKLIKEENVITDDDFPLLNQFN